MIHQKRDVSLMYRGDTSTKTIHQNVDVSPPIWSFSRLDYAWMSPNSPPITLLQSIISIRRTIPLIPSITSLHVALVDAHGRRKWELLSAQSGDTSIATIHQKLDVSPRYISDTLPSHLVRGGSTIHQIIDVSSTIHRYTYTSAIHQN